MSIPPGPPENQESPTELLRELAELRARLAAVEQVSSDESPANEEWARRQAEEALRASESKQRELEVSAEVEQARLAAVLANLPVGVWIADRNGKLVGKNEAADRIWAGEAPLPELVENYTQYAGWYADSGKELTPEDYPLAKALVTGQPVEEVELNIRRFDGTAGTVLVSAAPVKDGEGLLVGAVGINVDITERKRAAERLRGSHDTFHHLIQNNPFGIYLVDADFKLMQVSLGARKVFSNVNPLLGRDFAQVLRVIWPEPFAGEAIARFRHTLDTGEPFVSYSTVEQRKDIGEREAYDWRIERITLPDGRFGVVCFFYDLSERQRLEEALRESEARYRTLFNTMLEGFCVIEMIYDAEGNPVDFRFLQANEVFEEQSGLREVLGKTMRELIPDHEEYWFQAYGQVALTGTPVHFVNEAKGLNRWYEIYAYRLGGPGSRQVAIMFNNVTELKKAEEALRRFNETLEQQVVERTAVAEQRAKQLQALALQLTEAEEQVRRRIAALLHDDLQQLLTASRYKLSVFRRGPRTIETAGVLLEEVDQLLSQSIQKSRQLSHELSPAILHHSGLVAAVEWLARATEERHGLPVQIEAENWKGLQNESLEAFLFRAIQELLLNIVKHAESGSASVSLHGAEDQLQVRVSDFGKGFDSQNLENPKRTGDGFGLFSIGERARCMGGSLTIDSSPGKGSRITLTLPLEGLQEEKERTAFTSGSGWQPAPAAPTPETGKKTPYRVLLADDHAMMRQGLIALLKSQPDIEVVGEATNGRQAVEMARKLRPDLVLMDVVMPEMDGIEATTIIKREMPSVRVIGLSMFGDSEVSERLVKAGAEAYVNKGSASEALIEAIWVCR
jgi:PAS domain S-box-containing protein